MEEHASEKRGLPGSFGSLPRVIVVCGHYGAGKTNFALNLTYDLALGGAQVTLVDLDIVNPYFRSSDHGQALADAGIALVCPQSAGTALDSPMLSVAIDSSIEAAQRQEGCYCIIDAGGDDVGATALGRFSKLIASAPYAMLYVVNTARELTSSAEDARELLSEVELASRLRATHLVDNTHLMQFTDAQVLQRGMDACEELSRQTGLEVLCTTVPTQLGNVEGKVYPSGLEKLLDEGELACDNPYFVSLYVRKPWDA